MSAKPVVNVKPNKLSSGFTEAIEFCRELSRNTGDSDLDMSEVRFVSPSFLLPAMVYLQNLPYWPNMTNIGTYLSVVSFQNGGVDSSRFLRSSAFKSYMESYASKSFIPIIKFPTDLSGSDTRNAILDCIDNILGRQVKFGNNVRQALKYIIGEAVDNIVEHANSKFGYIVAQFLNFSVGVM